jgi:hypothetical protein
MLHMKKPLSFCTAVEASLTSGTESGEKQNESSLQGKKNIWRTLLFAARTTVENRILFTADTVCHAR